MVAGPQSAIAGPPTVAPVATPAKPTPLPVPRDGKGALAFGGMFMIGGAITTGLGIGSFVEGSPALGILGTVAGVHGLGVGLGATLLGVKRQRNHRRWLAATQLQPPRSGLGLLGAGTALMVGSVGVLLVSVYPGFFDLETTPWWSLAFMAAGSTGLAIGATALVIGSVRHHRFERWRAEHGRDVLPSVGVGPHGVYIGLSGRL